MIANRRIVTMTKLHDKNGNYLAPKVIKTKRTQSVRPRYNKYLNHIVCMLTKCLASLGDCDATFDIRRFVELYPAVASISDSFSKYKFRRARRHYTFFLPLLQASKKLYSESTRTLTEIMYLRGDICDYCAQGRGSFALYDQEKLRRLYSQDPEYAIWDDSVREVVEKWFWLFSEANLRLSFSSYDTEIATILLSKWASVAIENGHDGLFFLGIILPDFAHAIEKLHECATDARHIGESALGECMEQIYFT